jgi:glutathione S-transferase
LLIVSLELYYHPLASYCWKVLIALYEIGAPFEPHITDLMNERERAKFVELSPHGKFPVLRDTTRNRTILESTIINEYLTQHAAKAGGAALIPSDPERALEARYWDRFFDVHVHEHMQKVVGDRLRAEAVRDPFGVEHAKAQLELAYRLLDGHLRGKVWAIGDDFSIADCAAAPALYYANRVQPFGTAHAEVASYLERLHARPSFARVFREAAPYLPNFPV